HRDGVSESLAVVPVADGRKYVPELADVLSKRVGRNCPQTPVLRPEAQEVAQAAVAMVLAQRAASDPNVPREYQLDSLAIIPGRASKNHADTDNRAASCQP